MNRYQKIIDYLNRCIENNCLPHAYIFYGPDESAKKTVALKFADRILNTGAKFHPDLMLISADIDEERSINAIRQLKKFLTISSYSGKYKIAVVERAERLNLYAQNALLKIFEEAPPGSLIILCARTIDSISETIASRGVKLSFWRQNNLRLPAQENTEKTFNDILGSGFKKQYLDIFKSGNLKAVEIFRMWLEFLRIKFLASPNENLAKILKISQNIYFKLNETNVNPKLAYDELILNLWKF